MDFVISKTSNCLYMPKYVCSYLTYYAKITTNPKVYQENRAYTGISCLVPHPAVAGDYVTYQMSKLTPKSKIFKVHKIIDHEIVLLDFQEEPIDKATFEEGLEEHKRTPENIKYYTASSTVDGGSAHLEGSVYQLYVTYANDVPFMTTEQILQEKTVINTIRKNNV
jgi:hypothetical protein